MNISDLDKIIEQEAGVSICPICGTPYTKYHYRQVTCGTDECKKEHRARYMRERTERLRAEDLDGWRKKEAERQRKGRRKKKGLITIEENLQRAQEYWEREQARHYLEKPDGKGYAEQQIARTLAQVSKIDVNLERRANDDIHDKNT